MIIQPSENTKLSPEQLAQINVAENRLNNLSNEISVAIDTLTAARLDADRLTKERDYQQRLLDSVNKQLDTAQIQYSELVKEINYANVMLHETKTIADVIKSTHEEKSMALKERENAVMTRERQQTDYERIFSDKLGKLNQDKKEVEEKKAKIQSIINII